MSIFSFYPKVSYKIDNIDYLKAIDITNSLKVKNFLKDYRGISYNPYRIEDGEKPDLISYKVYGTPKYDWIILLANDIYNIYDEWPKDSQTLNEFIAEKYGSLSSASSTVKYYYDASGNIIDYDSWYALPSASRNSETEYEYEVRRNINKSKIKVIKPALIAAIDAELKSIVNKPIL